MRSCPGRRPRVRRWLVTFHFSFVRMTKKFQRTHATNTHARARTHAHAHAHAHARTRAQHTQHTQLFSHVIILLMLRDSCSPKKLEFCNGDFRALKALVLSTFAGVPLATSDSKASNDNFSDAQTPPVLYLDQGMHNFLVK